MGPLLLISPILSWPIHWLFFAGSTCSLHKSSTPSGLLQAERSDTECWALLFFIFVAFAFASPNLASLSKKQLSQVSFGLLFVQPLLLAFLRWPLLVEYMWYMTNLWSPTIICCAFPGLLAVFLLKRHLGYSRLLWLPIASFFLMAFAVDLVHTMGFLDTLVGEGNLAENSTFPWGLLLTIIASAWLSSLFIPYWFLWCSQAQRLDEARSHEIELLWKAFRQPSPEIYLWPTACSSSNAVLIGGLRQKKLLLTDKLLLTFSTTEIEWVLLHELSHNMRHHSLVRMLPTFLSVPCFLYILSCTQGEHLVIGCLLLGLALAGLIVATCWWTEWDADKYAIRLGTQYRNLSMHEASTQYANVLTKLYGSNQFRRQSWSHPSLEHRLAAVDKQSELR